MKARSIIAFTLSIVAVVFVLMAAAPAILSTNWVKQHYVVPVVEEIFDGEVSIEDLNLSWFGTQKIQKFSWKAHARNSSFDFDQLMIKAPLYKLFFFTPFLKEAKIVNLNVSLADRVTMTGMNGLIQTDKGEVSLLVNATASKDSVEGKLLLKSHFPLGYRQGLISFLLHRDESFFKSSSLEAIMEHFPSDFFNISVSPANILLSELIGPELNGTITYQGGVLNVVTNTNYGHSDFSVEFSSEGIHFPRNGEILYKMPQEAALKLKESGLFSLDSQLAITLIKGDSPSVHIDIGSVHLREGLLLKNLSGNAAFSSRLDSCTFDLKGLSDDRSGQNPITISGDLSFDPYLQYSVTAEAKGLKPSFLQPFFHDPKQRLRTLIASTLGSHIGVKFQFTNPDRIPFVNVQLDSDRAAMPGLLFQLDHGRIILAQPANIDVSLSPKGYLKQLPQNLMATIQIKQLDILLKEVIEPKDVILDAYVSTKEMKLDNLPLFGRCMLTNSLLSINGPSLAELNCSFIGRLNQFDESRTLSRAFGPEFRFESESFLGFDKDWDLIVKHFSLKSPSDEFHFHISGKQDPKDPYRLLISGKAGYLLRPERFLEIQGLSEPYYQLISPSNFELTIDQAEFNTRHPSFETLKFAGKIYVDHIDVGEDRSKSFASLNDVVIPWSFRAKSQELSLTLDAKTRSGRDAASGQVHLKAEIDHLMTKSRIDLSHWKVNAEMSVHAFPLAIVEALLAKDGLEELFGYSVDGEMKVRDDHEGEEGHVDFSFEGEDFKIAGALKARDSLTLEKDDQPITVIWEMSPHRFDAFRKFILHQNHELINQLTLYQSSTIAAQLSDLQIPLSDPYQTKGNLTLKSDKISILDSKTDDVIYLDGFSARLATQNFSRSVNVDIESKGHIYNRTDDEFILSLHASFDHLIDSYGGVNIAGSSMKMEGFAKQAPVNLISNFFSIDSGVVNQIEGLIGHRLDAQLGLQLMQMNGPVKLNLAGTIGKLSLDGNIIQGGLTLNQPLIAEVTLTSHLTDSILDEIVPLLNSAVRADNTLQLVISPDGFYYPLWSNNPYQFTIGSMRVDFGKIYFENNFQISEILNLLKFTTPENLISVWFTPLYLSYENGIVTLQRFDMLVADRFPIAIWGKVDFPQDKVNLKIGLGGTTLKRAFGLKGVPKDYYLQISLKGSTESPSINMGNASTKISGFISQFRGTPPGKIFGGILDMLGGQKPTPRPTTSPFPWEG